MPRLKRVAGERGANTRRKTLVFSAVELLKRITRPESEATPRNATPFDICAAERLKRVARGESEANTPRIEIAPRFRAALAALEESLLCR
jgi:hypothetical protein